jgi:hypothetical protein
MYMPRNVPPKMYAKAIKDVSKGLMVFSITFLDLKEKSAELFRLDQ